MSQSSKKLTPTTVMFTLQELGVVKQYAAAEGRKLASYLRWLALKETKQLPEQPLASSPSCENADSR